MQYLSIIVFVFFALVEVKAQSSEDIIPETYVAYKTKGTMEIDGEANEQDWEKAVWTNDFIDIEGVKKPTYQTRAKMMWDEKYLYIFSQMEEPHVWANLKQRDTIIFYNNDFEVFVDPDGDTHNYYELEINALNTAWDLLITKPYRTNNETINDFDVLGLKSAVHVNGTLNNPEDKDKGWSLEIAIPWSTFKTGYFQDIVPKDEYWRMNFSRVNWDIDVKSKVYSRKKDKNGKYLHEYNWVWSPTGVINMHEPEKWAYVFFSTKDVGSNITFTIPKDEKVKWELYKLYRAHLAFIDKNNSLADQIQDLTTDNIRIEGEILTPQLERHSLGWQLSIKSPFSGKLLFVNENGRFLSK